MTLDQAIFELRAKGLPFPSAISVFLLYQKVDEDYRKGRCFEKKFTELLKIQQTIQQAYIENKKA
ncbi:MAG: hypothetical protein RL637_1556 [Pseudomonadota bacterium]|jgi:hypothetical protein